MTLSHSLKYPSKWLIAYKTCSDLECECRTNFRKFWDLIEQETIYSRYEVEPKIGQIKYQIQKYKKQVLGDGEISLGELKQFLLANSKISTEFDEPFVLTFDVKMPKKKTLDISENEDTNYEDDEDEVENDDDEGYEISSFWFLFTTLRLLKLLLLTEILAADSTFKLVWQGFSGILIGTVDKRKQYHKICFGMSTSEKTSDWAEMFKVSNWIFRFWSVNFLEVLIILRIN